MEDQQEKTLSYLKGEMAPEEAAAFEDTLARSSEIRTEMERSRALLDALEAAGEQAAARRVERTIGRAIELRASDIHVVPGVKDVVVSFRIDGVLHEFERYAGDLHDAVLSRWKVCAGMSPTEHRLPQDGHSLVEHQGDEYDLRVNIIPTLSGERVTARLLDRQGSLYGFDALGLSPAHRRQMERLADLPNGLVVVSGPTGSGKTTTLYAMIKHIIAPGNTRLNVMSIEDPVEWRIDGVSQIPVNRQLGVTFAAAMRATFRADPDVIMVGEIRDQEMLEMAIQAAVTGHLALTTLHTADAVGGVARLLDIASEPYIVADAVAGVTAQRLVRAVCPECVEEYAPSETALKALGLTRADGPYRHGRGCAACDGRGYRGRKQITEVIEMTEPLRRLVASKAPREAIRDEAFRDGGTTILDDAREKVRSGVTTVEEASRVLQYLTF